MVEIGGVPVDAEWVTVKGKARLSFADDAEYIGEDKYGWRLSGKLARYDGKNYIVHMDGRQTKYIAAEAKAGSVKKLVSIDDEGEAKYEVLENEDYKISRDSGNR